MAKIIVELCQNHNGNHQVLKDMIYATKANGADIVKGQIIFSTNLFSTRIQSYAILLFS